MVLSIVFTNFLGIYSCVVFRKEGFFQLLGSVVGPLPSLWAVSVSSPRCWWSLPTTWSVARKRPRRHRRCRCRCCGCGEIGWLVGCGLVCGLVCGCLLSFLVGSDLFFFFLPPPVVFHRGSQRLENNKGVKHLGTSLFLWHGGGHKASK